MIQLHSYNTAWLPVGLHSKAPYSAIVYAAEELICAGFLLQVIAALGVNEAKTYYQIIRAHISPQSQVPLARILFSRGPALGASGYEL